MTEPSTPTTHSYNTSPSDVQPTDASAPQFHPPVGQPSLPPAPAPAKRKRHLFRKVFVGFVACVGLLVLLVAIAKPQAAVNAVAPGALPTTIPTSDVYVPPGATGEGSSAAPLAFGATNTYEDGLAVTVGKPQLFKPSKTAAIVGGAAARYVTMEIVITNGTTTNYAAASTVINATFAGAEVQRVYDAASKVSGAPTNDVLPGKSVVFRVGFAVPTKDAGELQVEVSPAYGIQYSNTILVGSV